MFLSSVGLAVAQPLAAPTTAPATEKLPTPPAPATLRGPQYMALRYNDDFSYLDGPPGSYRKDFFDPIKNIHLGDDWRLSLGGELRQRWESSRNQVFSARYPFGDTFLLQRYLYHANLKYRDLFRVYVEGIDASRCFADYPQLPYQQDRFDLNQGFFDINFLIGPEPLTLRVGRQELSYGKERLVGVLDWANVPRRFDGAKLFYHTPQFDIDAFWTKPVVFMYQPFTSRWTPQIDEGLTRKPDEYREEGQFFGVYSTLKGIPNHALDLYFLGLTDTGDLRNVNGHFGDLTLFTMGSRLGGTIGNFDHDTEFAGQWGTWAGDEIKAWMIANEVGYTLKAVPMAPRIGTGVDFATGDKTGGDRTIQTFNQLFPTGHAFLGYMDIVGRQNVFSPNVNFSFKPLKDVTVKAFYYHFWLASDTDALYNAGGVATRRDPSGAAGRDVGDEFDITANWRIDAHSSVLLGFSYFWPSSFMNKTGPSDDGSFYYVQYQFKF
jgi:hypothetical protein